MLMLFGFSSLKFLRIVKRSLKSLTSLSSLINQNYAINHLIIGVVGASLNITGPNEVSTSMSEGYLS